MSGNHEAGSLKNQWVVATEVWARFQEVWPGSKCGVWTDPVEGSVWVDARAKDLVEVRALDWHGTFHRRAVKPEQIELELA